MAAIGIIAAIAFPRLVGARARVDIAAARDAFVSTHALARQLAAQYGRLTRLHIDPDADAFWVTADTSTVPGVIVWTRIGPRVGVPGRFGGVRFDSNRRLLCFNSRALGTAAVDCELPNATVIFRRENLADTVTISRLGRVLKR